MDQNRRRHLIRGLGSSLPVYWLQEREFSCPARGSFGSRGLQDRGQERRRPWTVVFLMQTVGRSTLLELGKTLMPAPVVVNGPAVTDFEVAHQAEREAAQHRMADRGKAQIFSAKEAAADKRESLPQPLELSTMKMNPQAPGWNTRLTALCIRKIDAICSCFAGLGLVPPLLEEHRAQIVSVRSRRQLDARREPS